MALSPEILSLLSREFGERLDLSPQILAECAADASGIAGVPEAVLLAQDAADVSRLLILANEHGFPVIPRGGGSGLAGGAVAHRGGVVLSLAGLSRILRISPADMIAEVEPGVITLSLRQEAEKLGLCYPPDPAGMDLSTIGGNAATNAGGPSCLKYGVTRDYVLGLQAVLPSGEIIRTGAGTRKSVAGLDLTRLLVGSEGTLAVITALTLKLIPKPQAAVALAALFPDPATATRAVTAVFQAGVFPCALEFMDRACLTLVADLLPFPITGPGAAMLLVELDGSPQAAALDAERAAWIMDQAGATRVLPPVSGQERENLWAVRRQISLRIHEQAAVYLPEDVAVPLSRIPDLIDRLAELGQRFSLSIFAFGHAGDGNIHVNITAEAESGRERAEECASALVTDVLAMGGTISGEHGVGLAKKKFLPLELSPANLALQQGIKALLDPNNVLNPGKVLPDRTASALVRDQDLKK